MRSRIIELPGALDSGQLLEVRFDILLCNTLQPYTSSFCVRQRVVSAITIVSPRISYGSYILLSLAVFATLYESKARTAQPRAVNMALLDRAH